jgi:hypothetical protein
MEYHEIVLLKATADALKTFVGAYTTTFGYAMSNYRKAPKGGLAPNRQSYLVDLTRPSGRTSVVEVEVSINENIT